MNRQDWINVNLGDICDVVMGQSPPSSSYNTEGKGLPFFQGKAEFTDRYPVVKRWCDAPKKKAKPFDILISVRAPVGATNIANVECAIGRGLAAITYKPEYKYIWYYLQLIEKRLNEQGTGTTFRAISADVLKAQIVPLAPLPEQRAIVTKVEQLFSKLDNAVNSLKGIVGNNMDKTIGKAEMLRQSILKKAFEGTLLTEKELDACRKEPDWEPADKLLERIKKQRNE